MKATFVLQINIVLCSRCCCCSRWRRYRRRVPLTNASLNHDRALAVRLAFVALRERDFISDIGSVSTVRSMGFQRLKPSQLFIELLSTTKSILWCLQRHRSLREIENNSCPIAQDDRDAFRVFFPRNVLHVDSMDTSFQQLSCCSWPLIKAHRLCRSEWVICPPQKG